MSTSGNTGPVGHPRGIGFGILIFIVTFGVYSLYWVYQTQEEVKRHSGDGIGACSASSSGSSSARSARS